MSKSSTFTIFAGFTLTVLGGMIFDFGGLFAGRAATFLKDLSSFIPWIFLIYPLLLTVRGDINGVLTGKLGTALHLGTIKPNWKGNTERFKQLFSLILILTVYDSILISLVTSIVGFILPTVNFGYIDILKVFSVSMTTFFLTALISMVITFTLTFSIYKRKGDPDVYAYPITSSINDVLITLVFAGVCWLYQPWNLSFNLHYYLGIPVIILIIGIAIFLVMQFKKEKYIKQGLMQTLPVLTITNLIAAGTGSVLAIFSAILLELPILLVFYPAIISSVGSQNSILANTTTTKLHLGTIKPSISSLKSREFGINVAGILTAATIIITGISLIGIAILPENITFILYWKILALLLITNVFSFFVIGMIALFASFTSFRFGLDPDNLVNPLISSSADLITTIFLVLVFLLLF